MKNNKTRNIFIACVIGAIVIAAVCVICFIPGGPVQLSSAEKAILGYADDHFASQGFEYSNATYEPKTDTYTVRASSKTSADTYFDIFRRGSDGVIGDDYEISVNQRANTISRLQLEIEKNVGELLKDFIMEQVCVFAALETDESTVADVLPMDMKLDMSSIPVPLTLTVWFDSPGTDVSTLAKVLIELKALMEDNDVDVDSYSVSLLMYSDKTLDDTRKLSSKLEVTDVASQKILDNSEFITYLEEYINELKLETYK